MTQRVSVPSSASPTQNPMLDFDDDRLSTDDRRDVQTTSEPAPHEVERAITQRLHNHPSLKFTRLSVHQCNRDSVCLEGVLEANEDEVNLSDIVRGIHDFKEIIDRVVPPRSSVKVPRKG